MIMIEIHGNDNSEVGEHIQGSEVNDVPVRAQDAPRTHAEGLEPVDEMPTPEGQTELKFEQIEFEKLEKKAPRMGHFGAAPELELNKHPLRQVSIESAEKFVQCS